MLLETLISLSSFAKRGKIFNENIIATKITRMGNNENNKELFLELKNKRKNTPTAKARYDAREKVNSKHPIEKHKTK